MLATSKNTTGAINNPKHPSDQGTHIFLKFALYLVPLYFFPLFQTPKKKPKNTPKNTSKSLDSSFFTKNTRYCFRTQSSFPWFYAWDLGFRGVDVAFLAIIHTPNLIDLFSSIYLSFY